MQLLYKVNKDNVVSSSDSYELSPRNFISTVKETKESPIVRPEVDELMEASRQEADSIIREAEEQAEAILEKARAEAVVLREQARKEGQQEGYRQGFDEGLADARAEGEQITAQARQVLSEAEECCKETIASMEPEIVSLAREIAEKLVAAQLSVEPETVLHIAREALQLLRDREQLAIFAHPSEAELFKERREELLKLLPEKAVLKIIADPGVEPGGCRLETERGLVDCSLDNRWDGLLKALYAEGG